MKSTVKINKNDTLTLTVSAMSFAGLGIARYSDPAAGADNYVFFISGAVVGDVCRCLVLKVGKSYGYAKILEILSPSADRIPADCNVFGKCGGCSFLNTEYRAELSYKSRIVADAFSKNGFSFVDRNSPVMPLILPEPILTDMTPEGTPEVVGSPETEYYRNKVIYPLSPEGKFGFYAHNSHRCCACYDCRLQDRLFTDIAGCVQQFIADYGIRPYDEAFGTGLFRHLFLRRGKSSGQLMVCLILAEERLPHQDELIRRLSRFPEIRSVYINVNPLVGNTVLGRRFSLIYGEPYIEDTLCGLRFRISPAAFWQINSRQAENLYNYAVNAAEITENDTVLDLCCGTGTLALIAAKNTEAKRVFGVEIVPEAIEDAKQNAEANGIENCTFLVADAAETYDVIKNECKGSQLPNVVIVDPPRKGLDEEAIRQLKRLSPDRIVYISCDPHTQARDLSRLIYPNLGDSESVFLLPTYRVRSLRAFDMFPRTPHVETVVLMTRTGTGNG